MTTSYPFWFEILDKEFVLVAELEKQKVAEEEAKEKAEKAVEEEKAREALISPLIDLPPIDKANSLIPGIKFVGGKAVLENEPANPLAEPLPVKMKFTGVDEEGKIGIKFN